MSMQQSSYPAIKVWDPIVRIGHWVLVLGFATAYLTEGEPEWLHTYAGYAVAVTVAVRVVWGFVGPSRARFSDFVTGPGEVFRYLFAMVSGNSKRYLGHSPAGGAMTLALLLMLALTAFSGMANLAAEDGEGPLAGIIARTPEKAAPAQSPEAPALTGEEEEDEEGEAMEAAGEEGGKEESFWLEIHEVSANIVLFLVILHIGGVAVASFAHRENLPRSMVTGLKRP